jgi:hypothetical protein
VDIGWDDWIRTRVGPVRSSQVMHDRPWATVTQVTTAEEMLWFKACAPIQSFEPRLSAQLFSRWPDRVAEVVAHEEDRGWLLLRDAGQPINVLGNPPKAWLATLPLYAELQRGESAYSTDHVTHGVPDLRLRSLPERYEQLTARDDLPVGAAELIRMRGFVRQLTSLCDDLAARGVAETIQHDDLHMANLFTCRGTHRVLDWGDSSISHPFASFVVMFRFLEERNKLAPMTRGSLGCATPTLNRGEPGTVTPSPSRSALAQSHTRWPGSESATPFPTPPEKPSIPASPLC